MFFIFPRKTSSPGSLLRRLMTFVSVLLIGILVAENFFPVFNNQSPLLEAISAIVLFLWAVAYFCLVVIAVPFLTSQNFWPNSVRLAGDTLVSITQTILAFAICYRLFGIVGPEQEVSPWSHVYFSTVTFSTLGYGDFSPDSSSRGFAAAQAIIGNLHLGMIVGVAFFAVNPAPNPKKRLRRSLQREHQCRRKKRRT